MFDDNQEFDFEAQAPAWEDCLNDPFHNLPDFNQGEPISDDIIEAVAAFSPDYHNTIRVKAEVDVNPFGLIASAIRSVATWLGL